MADSELPGRITDPKKLRALAHPLRWKLIAVLGTEDAATATRCAEITGESVASCSYHLNMLAKYGYVEHAEGGQRREKPWRLTTYEQSWSPEGLDTEGQLAVEELSQTFLDYQFNRLSEYHRRRSLLPQQWREAGGILSGVMFVTAEELAEIKQELVRISDRYRDRLDNPSARPEGARPAHRLFALNVDPDPQIDHGSEPE